MRKLIALAAASTALFTAPIWAQGSGDAIPPLHSSVDGNGVNLMSGEFFTSSPAVSIGGQAGGLSYSQLIYGEDWRHSTFGTINRVGTTFHVTVGGNTELFTTSYLSLQSSGSTLSYSSTFQLYTYTLRDGTVVTFSKNFVGDFNQHANEAVITSIESPAGAETNFFYGSSSWTEPGIFPMPDVTYTISRLQSVTNNFGYQLHFRYTKDQATSLFDWVDFYELIEVTALNNTIEACPSQSNTCTLTNSWPTLTISYGSNWREYTDALGFDTRIYWTADGIDYIDFPGGVGDDIDITYDTNGQVQFFEDGQNNRWTYAYTTSTVTVGTDLKNLETTTVTQPDTNTIVFESRYDDATGVFEQTVLTDQAGQDWTNVYDAQGRVTQAYGPYGNYVTYVFDNRSNITSMTHNPTSGGGALTTTASYPTGCVNTPTCNQPIWTEDAGGHRTNYAYNSTTGQLTEVLAPAPSGGAARPEVDYTYVQRNARVYVHGGPVTNLDPVWMPHTTRSCANGTVASCSVPLTINEVVYEASTVLNNVRPVQQASCSGDWTASTMNGQTWVCSTSGGTLRSATETSWNRFGLPQTVDGPLPGPADTTAYYYDSLGQRLEGMAGPDPDGLGSLVHRAVRYEFNSTTGLVDRVERGRLASQAWPISSLTVHDAVETDYDNMFRPVTQRRISVASGGAETTESVVQTSYNNLSQADCVALRMNPTTYGALPASPCVLATTGSYGPDRITRYQYRSTGQVSAVTSGYATAAAYSEFYIYWDDGQLALVADGEGREMGYTYDTLRRLQGVFYSDPATGLVNYTDYQFYGYDSTGRMWAMFNRDGSTVTYSFDNLHRVTNVHRSGSTQRLDLSYDNSGRVTQRHLVNYTGIGQTNNLTYDALGRLTQSQIIGGSITSAINYQYDEAHRRIQMQWDAGTYINYDYDVTGALTAIRENGATSGIGVLAQYAYDTHGRVTTLTRGNGAVTTYGYDNASRLTSLAHDVAGTANDVTFTYAHNPAGQIIQRRMNNGLYAYQAHTAGTITDTVNGLNQVTNTGGQTVTHDTDGNTTGIGTASLGYDDIQRLTSTPGGSTLAYAADGQLASIGSNRRFQYDGASLATEYDSGGAVTARFVGAGGLGAPVMEYDGSGTGTREWLLTDERGSVIGRADNIGNVSGITAYDEYGRQNAGNPGTYGYTGMVRLDNGALTHNRNRAYHARLGRFLHTDPIGQEGGINVYAYTGGDPVNHWDPLGLYSNGCFHHDRSVCAANGYLEPMAYWPSEQMGGFHPNSITLSLYGSLGGMGWENVARVLDGLTLEQGLILMEMANNACGGVEAIVMASISGDNPTATGSFDLSFGSAFNYGISTAWTGFGPRFGDIRVETGGNERVHPFYSGTPSGDGSYLQFAVGSLYGGSGLSFGASTVSGVSSFSALLLGVASSGACIS